MTITALYRGKSKKTGKWYYGSYLKLNSEHFIVSNYSGIMIEVEPETIGQFTGLLDKYNNKVFDGDILLFRDKLITVYWDGERFQWMAKEAIEYPWSEYPNKDWNYIDLGWIAAEPACIGEMTTPIVGNIYDNPEMYEVTKKKLMGCSNERNYFNPYAARPYDF